MFVHFILLIYILYIEARASFRNDLIFDYFGYKKVPSVVGISCNKLEDFLLIKKLNVIGLSASIYTIKDGYEVRRLASTTYTKIGVFLDFRCYSKEDANLIFSNASRFYGELHYWLIISSSLEDVTSSLDDERFNLSTDFVVAVPSSTNLSNKHDLYDVYNPWKRRGSELNVTFLGSWNENHELNIVLNDLKLRRRCNMNRLPFKALFFWTSDRSISMPLEDFFQIYEIDTHYGMEKFSLKILSHFTEMYNLTLQTNMAPQWAAGDMVGPIQRAIYNDEGDVGPGTSLTPVRYNYVRFPYLAWPFRSCFMFRTPKKKDVNEFNDILGPFDAGVWYMIVILIVSCTLLMSLMFRYEGNDTKTMRCSNSFFLLIGSMCQQGTEMEMVQLSTRLAFLWVMISSLLIFNYYGAAVVSVRLNEPIIKINDSLIELSKLDLKYSSQWLAFFELMIKSSDYEVQLFYNQSWKYVPESEQFMDPEQGMKLVKEGGFAYHTMPDTGYPMVLRYFNPRETCELTEVNLWRAELTSFAISLNCTITELVRVGLTKIGEVGIQYRQLKRWYGDKPVCDPNTIDATGITIYEFGPHLLILIVGMGLSAVILICEIAQWNLRVHDESKADKMIRLRAWI